MSKALLEQGSRHLAIYNRAVREIEFRTTGLDAILRQALFLMLWAQTPASVIREYKENGYSLHEAIHEEISYL